MLIKMGFAVPKVRDWHGRLQMIFYQNNQEEEQNEKKDTVVNYFRRVNNRYDTDYVI